MPDCQYDVPHEGLVREFPIVDCNLRSRERAKESVVNTKVMRKLAHKYTHIALLWKYTKLHIYLDLVHPKITKNGFNSSGAISNLVARPTFKL